MIPAYYGTIMPGLSIKSSHETQSLTLSLKAKPPVVAGGLPQRSGAQSVSSLAGGRLFRPVGCSHPSIGRQACGLTGGQTVRKRTSLYGAALRLQFSLRSRSYRFELVRIICNPLRGLVGGFCNCAEFLKGAAALITSVISRLLRQLPLLASVNFGAPNSPRFQRLQAAAAYAPSSASAASASTLLSFASLSSSIRLMIAPTFVFGLRKES